MRTSMDTTQLAGCGGCHVITTGTLLVYSHEQLLSLRAD